MAESKKVVVERGLPRVVEIRNAAGAAGQAVSSGAGVPSTTPSAVGDVYVDTTNDNAYVATGTASSADWKQATGAGGGDLLAANNLSDVAAAATARTNLGLAIGTDVQAHSAVLDATTASFLTADETKLDGIEVAADVTDATNVAAAGAPIITSGAGAPSSTPSAVGDVYIDTTGDVGYIATGTASSADWDQATGAGGGDLLAANNLSELTATAATARSNIGAGVGDFLANGTVTMAGNLDMGGFQIQDVAIFLDSSLNTILGITTKGASAVNYLDIANALAGAGPTITALGTDANIDINLIPKGSGDVNITPTGDINLSAAGTKVNSSGDITVATTIELGHATDTTLSRVSAGVAAIEGNNIIVSGGALGTPASGVATNLTGTAAGLTVGATTGVEAGADVTDTTNVTAAGALMDSECTSLADVKALDQSVISGATPTFTGTNFTGIPVAGMAALTASRAVVTDGSGKSSAATTTATEIGHVNGVTSAIQTQLNTKGAIQRYRTIYLDAGAKLAPTTAPATAGTNEYVTNDLDFDYFAFATAADSYAQFKTAMPDDWDLGTIKVKFYWTYATGASDTEAVTWGVQAVAIGNSDPIDAAWGTVQIIADALTAANGTDMQVSGATPALTVGGSPAGLGEMVAFRVFRDVSADAIPEDAWLFGIQIQYQTLTTEPAAW